MSPQISLLGRPDRISISSKEQANERTRCFVQKQVAVVTPAEGYQDVDVLEVWVVEL